MNNQIKILIIEDYEDDAELLKRQLKKSEFSITSEIVETRETYENALEHFKPDIILSDYSLPSFDGVTAFNIKQQKYPDIPFIIVSSTIGEEKAVELIRNGVTDYVLKENLFGINQKISRALKEAEEKKEKKIAAEKLKKQNAKLLEIAFLQAHQVRAPVANVLGLINLLNFENPNDPINVEILKRLRETTIAFDNIIHEIVKITSEIKAIKFVEDGVGQTAK